MWKFWNVTNYYENFMTYISEMCINWIYSTYFDIDTSSSNSDNLEGSIPNLITDISVPKLNFFILILCISNCGILILVPDISTHHQVYLDFMICPLSFPFQLVFFWCDFGSVTIRSHLSDPLFKQFQICWRENFPE